MVLETVNSAIHCALPEKLSKAPLDHKFPNHRKQVNRAADSCDYQPNRKKTTGRAERLYLAEPHRRDGNDGHVEGVENRQVLDQPVAGCADYGHRRDQRDCERESASWGHPAAVRGDLCERAMSRKIPPRITCHTPNWNVSGTPRIATFSRFSPKKPPSIASSRESTRRFQLSKTYIQFAPTLSMLVVNTRLISGAGIISLGRTAVLLGGGASEQIRRKSTDRRGRD